MASRTNKLKGKVSANPMKPKLAANIKLAQGLGGGIKQGKGGAKYVTSARPGTGLKQNGTGGAGKGAKKAPATKVGVNKLNKKPISAQPKSPKNNKNTLVRHNSVTKGDVARLRKAHNLATPPMTGGGFKSFIQGK